MYHPSSAIKNVTGTSSHAASAWNVNIIALLSLGDSFGSDRSIYCEPESLTAGAFISEISSLLLCVPVNVTGHDASIPSFPKSTITSTSSPIQRFVDQIA